MELSNNSIFLAKNWFFHHSLQNLLGKFNSLPKHISLSFSSWTEAIPCIHVDKIHPKFSHKKSRMQKAIGQYHRWASIFYESKWHTKSPKCIVHELIYLSPSSTNSDRTRWLILSAICWKNSSVFVFNITKINKNQASLVSFVPTLSTAYLFVSGPMPFNLHLDQ